MELLQLRYFQTVAKLGSITQAGKIYRIPQPAISQTISRLERELGVSLFTRQSNKIILNERGQQFLSYIDKALAELDDGIRAIQSDNSEIGGAIRLLATENRRFVLSCVSTFAKEYPNVNFSISHEYTGDPTAQYDLCIHSAPQYQHMNTAVPLIQEKIVLNVNENHWAASRKDIHLSELQSEKFITMSSSSSLYQITLQNCRSCGFEPRIPFICDDPYYVRKYVSENMGIALAPALSWAGRFRSNTKLIDVTDPSIHATSYLIWDEHRYQSPAVILFREYLQQEAQKLE